MFASQAWRILRMQADKQRWETTVESVIIQRRFRCVRREVLRKWRSDMEVCVALRGHARILWLFCKLRCLIHTLSAWFRHIQASKIRRSLGAKIAARHRVMLVEDAFEGLRFGVQELIMRRQLLL